MIKRVSFILVLALVLTLCAACAAAPVKTEETIFYEDGSYLVVTTVASGRMTTAVIEGGVEMIPQSNQGQDGCSYTPLSYQAGLEDQERSVRNREAMDSVDWKKSAGWVFKDGKRFLMGYDRNGMPIYRSEVATKYCSYYSADHRLLWTMSLTGIFRENIIDRNCDIVSSNVMISEQDSWYVIAEAEEKDIDDVFYTVRFGRKNLGVTIAEPSYTISLSRDEKGDFH